MMQNLFLLLVVLPILFRPASGFAQGRGDWLPQSDVKSPYAALSVPTALKPVPDSLASLLTKGYLITTTADYGGSGALFTLVWQRQTVICVLTAPVPGTDQNVPTSRCWALN
ncbi:hypothetical protein NO263_01615 [Gluconacetobacter entanii]|uniref:Uncharacterized protein n=1 Tax=Gluconacetobacter entanii TaxID=108528 RepID=A0ABT3K1K8_9PROT|nr:hypothetical protein [Gluconacetobacter entanii]MCW4589288.1 hypothetical protein [Gluconacetobacter entanii]MCW4592883.1 hypothetical protein [Gluconacetobacter entanii]